LADVTSDILFERRDAVGHIMLNRPQALNALTHAMCVAMKAQLDHWAVDANIKTVVVEGAGERAFCAGGDIRSLYESGRTGTPYARRFYRDEYLLDAAIKHYPKPYVALISGIVMGGGVGVSVHGNFRIADETTTFAMPETGIGLFPDVGGSYFLPRLEGALGMYLALTGARLKGGDTFLAGIATHFVPKAKRADVLARLESGTDVQQVISGASAYTGPASYAKDKIEAIFSLTSIETVLAALDADGSDWARTSRETILMKSPTSTKLAFRQLQEGARLEFDQCMKMEFRMVNRVIAGHDFYEGVRATIIDKDNKPRWQPATLAEVTEAGIEAYFAPLAEGELPL
jgi:enoyl-CoA hydratase/carnithine racemase